MSLHHNNELLKNTLEALPLLDGRFEQLKLVNMPPTGEKRGCFSLVFHAWDRLENKSVALKFYDIDPATLSNQYRRTCFDREHAILQQVMGVDRCLQLASSLSLFYLQVPTGPGPTDKLTLPCSYFAVEWISDQIDHHFFNQHANPAIDKLRLFCEIALSVEALHNHGVFHRDLKADNLRSYMTGLRRVVVAIDLGTAARIASQPIASAYAASVGAPAYAAPEATSTLAGIRSIAHLTDMYALGCLLFELFHRDFYYTATRFRNTHLDMKIAAMQQGLHGAQSEEERLAAWHAALKKVALGVSAPSLDSPGSSCPAGIRGIIDEVVEGLTKLDYRDRWSLRRARDRISSALRLLSNEVAYAAEIKNRKARRDARLRKAEVKKHRLELEIKAIKS